MFAVLYIVELPFNIAEQISTGKTLANSFSVFRGYIIWWSMAPSGLLITVLSVLVSCSVLSRQVIYIMEFDIVKASCRTLANVNHTRELLHIYISFLLHIQFLALHI